MIEYIKCFRMELQRPFFAQSKILEKGTVYREQTRPGQASARYVSKSAWRGRQLSTNAWKVKGFAFA